MSGLYYQWFDNHTVCRIWHKDIVIPVKGRKKDGKEYTFYKDIEQDYSEDKGYWEYVKDKYSDEWLLYRVNNVKHDRRLALRTRSCFAPTALIASIADKEITVNDCRRIEEFQRESHFRGERIHLVVKWSHDFNGKHIAELLATKPKMTFSEVLLILQSEGGSIDANGIIHEAK